MTPLSKLLFHFHHHFPDPCTISSFNFPILTPFLTSTTSTTLYITRPIVSSFPLIYHQLYMYISPFLNFSTFYSTGIAAHHHNYTTRFYHFIIYTITSRTQAPCLKHSLFTCDLSFSFHFRKSAGLSDLQSPLLSPFHTCALNLQVCFPTHLPPVSPRDKNIFSCQPTSFLFSLLLLPILLCVFFTSS